MATGAGPGPRGEDGGGQGVSAHPLRPLVKTGCLSGRSELEVSKATESGRARQLDAASFPLGAIEAAVGFQPL